MYKGSYKSGVDYDVEKIWQQCVEGLRLTLSLTVINTYFKKVRLLSIHSSGDRLICELGAEPFARDMVEKRYLGQIADELSRITSKQCEVRVVTKRWEEKADQTTDTQVLGPLFEPKHVDFDLLHKTKLKEGASFDHYAVGGSNQMAFAAAQAVAKRLGMAYNPLLIYGGVGVGKTHLMQAIGNEIIQKGETRVLFCTSEQFTNDLVEGIKNKNTEQVRSKYRRLKLLMIDDVQFIAGKGSAQEEFFHTFNALVSDGAQVVMTSDRPPAEISKLEPRLRSRFGAGLIVEIAEPDLELRAAILLIKAKQRNFDLKTDLATLIADHVTGIRELDGFLSRLSTEAESQGGIIDESLVRHALQLSPQSSNMRRQMVPPADVISAIAKFYGVTVSQLKGERRTKSVAWPRQILMYFLAHEMKLGVIEVGRLIGGRDHTTILHGRDKVLVELETNQAFKSELSEVRRHIFQQ